MKESAETRVDFLRGLDATFDRLVGVYIESVSVLGSKQAEESVMAEAGGVLEEGTGESDPFPRLTGAVVLTCASRVSCSSLPFLGTFLFFDSVSWLGRGTLLRSESQRRRSWFAPSHGARRRLGQGFGCKNGR